MCFRKAAVAILGAAAPMTVASWDTNCRGVALVRAYSDFVVRALGLHRANAGRPKHFVNVTYSARRASVQWPERAFCDTKRSYFDCGQLDHLQLRKLAFGKTTNKVCKAPFPLRSVQFLYFRQEFFGFLF